MENKEGEEMTTKEREKKDKELLKKFKEKGNYVVSDEEEQVLDKYAPSGWVSYGIDLVKGKATAKLTPRGSWLWKTLGR